MICLYYSPSEGGHEHEEPDFGGALLLMLEVHMAVQVGQLLPESVADLLCLLYLFVAEQDGGVGQNLGGERQPLLLSTRDSFQLFSPDQNVLTFLQTHLTDHIFYSFKSLFAETKKSFLFIPD